MLPLERFHEETHEERMEAARRHIPLLTADWTNLQEYDPGMTLLELLSWLTDVQRRYMEGIPTDSERRLLSLLGVPQLHAQGARTLLSFEPPGETLRLPTGVKFRAGELIFENNAPLAVTPARLMELHLGSGPRVTMDALREGCNLALLGEAPKPGAWFELEFDMPLLEHETVGLAFELRQPEGSRRVPIPPNAAFVPLARVRWQALCKDGWRDVAVERDDTHGLLCSGLVYIKPDGAGARLLRATLEGGGYDLPPRVRDIAFPVLEVEQRDTLCGWETITAEALRQGRGELHSFLALYGQTQCYRRIGNVWRACPAQVTPDPAGGVAHVTLPGGTVPEEASELLAVFRDGERCPGPVNGAGRSGQFLTLPGPGAEHGRFSLLVGEGEDLFFWRNVEDFYGSGPGDRAYCLAAEEGKVRFGDGRCGMAPPKGAGNIHIAGLSLTRGLASNLQPGQIGSPAGPYADLRVRQITAAVGGRDEESIVRRRHRCMALHAESDRAVTVEDYEKIVLGTPGLILEDVRILPNQVLEEGRVRNRPGTVSVLVRGAGHGGAAEGYVENIRKRLEPRRLAGTRAEVVYVGVERL